MITKSFKKDALGDIWPELSSFSCSRHGSLSAIEPRAPPPARCAAIARNKRPTTALMPYSPSGSLHRSSVVCVTVADSLLHFSSQCGFFDAGSSPKSVSRAPDGSAEPSISLYTSLNFSRTPASISLSARRWSSSFCQFGTSRCSSTSLRAMFSRNRYSVARSTDDSSILFLFGYRREHDLRENSLTQGIVKVV